ncbi:antibiotic biosynthesis monooxygenase family protein [Marinobacterium aestuariivivens]
MFTVLYRWIIAPDQAQDFISGWEAVTDHFIEHHGALGSRLHRVADNTFAAYAQWRSREARAAAFAANDAPEAAVEKMNRAIVDRLEPIEMGVVSDRLIDVS